MTAAEIRTAAIHFGERAIASSRAALGADGWETHGAWVEAYVVACAKQWALAQAAKR